MSSKNKEKEYEWFASGNAPDLYPVKIFFGNYIFSNGEKLYIPTPVSIGATWGYPVSTYVLNRSFYPVPEFIDIVWFSFVENQFYSVEAALPKERINSLFSEINQIYKRSNYNYIVAGMAPYGRMAIWLSGIGGEK